MFVCLKVISFYTSYNCWKSFIKYADFMTIIRTDYIVVKKVLKNFFFSRKCRADYKLTRCVSKTFYLGGSTNLNLFTSGESYHNKSHILRNEYLLRSFFFFNVGVIFEISMPLICLTIDRLWSRYKIVIVWLLAYWKGVRQKIFRSIKNCGW